LASRYRLEIRAADSADAPGVAKLMQAAGWPVPPKTVALRLERLRAQQAIVLLAMEWGPPSGIIIVQSIQSLEADLPLAIASTLLVHPEARRKGVGRLLLKAATQASRSLGCGDFHLTAPRNQESLREFCRATGFSETSAGFVRPLRKRS
jgi:aminoglycoside 6'-N-acetyltransferase I